MDFRCLRFPGLISAVTVPSGGTSDYAPEMIHAAAEGKPYACFVREDTRIPFMAMPDGVDALLRSRRRRAARSRGRSTTWARSPRRPARSATSSLKSFPAAQVTFEPDVKRQGIVDSWPADVDDRAARADWGFAPKYGLEAAFSRLPHPDDPRAIPGLKRRFGKRTRSRLLSSSRWRTRA